MYLENCTLDPRLCTQLGLGPLFHWVEFSSRHGEAPGYNSLTRGGAFHPDRSQLWAAL